MDIFEIIILLTGVLSAALVSFLVYKAFKRRSNRYSIVIAAVCFIGIFILTCFAAHIAFMIFYDGFSRR
jgi:succinate dehydrogenase hydrophobic anchor subunit